VNVYLFRHGPAVDSVGGLPDVDRTLTGDGRAKTQLASRGLKRLGVVPQVIATSPAKRALETATIAAKVLGFSDPLTVLDGLRPGSAPETFLHVVAGYTDDLLIVGHEPDLGNFAAFMLGLAGHHPLALGKAGAAALDVTAPRAGGAELRWFLRRRELAKLGK
jgi:phosphohistidine phosphatase